MLTGPEYNSKIIKVLNANGIETDEAQGRSDEFISSIRDSARGEVINQMFLLNRAVSPMFYQEMYFTEDDYVKDGDCVVQFKCPPPMYKLDGSPWVEWIGGKDWNSQSARFRLAASRAEVVNKSTHHILGRKQLVRAFYDNAMGYWWVYSNQGTVNFAVRQICATPYDAPNFNINTDPYPFPSDQDNRLMEAVIRMYYRILQGPSDSISNSRNDAQLNPVRR